MSVATTFALRLCGIQSLRVISKTSEANSSLTRNTLDGVVYPENRYRCLEGGLQTADLADRGLEDTRSYIVSRFAVEQVETVSEQHLLRIADRRLLGGVVVRTQLRHELRGILRRVDCEGLRND